jgi:hypothetical protein
MAKMRLSKARRSATELAENAGNAALAAATARSTSAEEPNEISV